MAPHAGIEQGYLPNRLCGTKALAGSASAGVFKTAKYLIGGRLVPLTEKEQRWNTAFVEAFPFQSNKLRVLSCMEQLRSDKTAHKTRQHTRQDKHTLRDKTAHKTRQDRSRQDKTTHKI